MNIIQATREYETWLGQQTMLIEADLDIRRRQMAQTPFAFLRATFYRWLQRWPTICADLAGAPAVLAVGDLHVENFGTWRDGEGRLIWGVNDFDDAYPAAYTSDLTRLATSAKLTSAANGLKLTTRAACDSILAGYDDALKAGGRPFVLAEEHSWLRKLALSQLRDPAVFWSKLDELTTTKQPIPSDAIAALMALLPEPHPRYRVVHRVAGLGSLGRQRWLALAEWRGGRLAREAKAYAPPTAAWLDSGATTERFYTAIIGQAIRAPDPLVQIQGQWIVRRLAPDCSRIELVALPSGRDLSQLLYAMGWETANIHLGSTNALKDVARDLRRRPSGWLRAAVQVMARAVIEDWEAWRRQNSA
jgi:hypothetical protein